MYRCSRLHSDLEEYGILELQRRRNHRIAQRDVLRRRYLGREGWTLRCQGQEGFHLQQSIHQWSVLRRNVHCGLHVHHGMGILDHHVQGFGRLDIIDRILEQEVIRSGEEKVSADREGVLGRVVHNLHCSCLDESEQNGDRAGRS